VSGAKGVKFGQATIAVVDDVGNPVAGALVSDEFTGDLVDSVVEVQADGNGISLVQTSQSIRKLRNLQFCVTAITDRSNGNRLLPVPVQLSVGLCSSLNRTLNLGNFRMTGRQAI
jgi:hypothetical protein